LKNLHSEPWWRTGVIYQIYPRSFQDTNGDGIGDLQGIIRRLEYLTECLGVNAIWLSPFYPSPMADFGYDVSDYVDVDPLFGTLADFDELLASAHDRGLGVIIDFVPNHTSDEHPWFVDSRSSRESAHRQWYLWRDPKPDGSPPNNWLSLFGGPAWEWDASTKQYYLHRYLKKQPDLNWRNSDVKRAIFDAARFWLDRGVDGFRIDAAQGIMKDRELRDNPPGMLSENPYKNLGPWDSQIHKFDEGDPDIHEIYRELRAILNTYSDERPRAMIAEIHVWDHNDWASYFGHGDEIHLPFNFGLVGIPWNAARAQDVVESVEGVMRQNTWPAYVLGNHDEHRLATRLGPDRARVAQMLLLTLRGTPTLYYGDELGMRDVAIDPADMQDPFEHGVPGLGLGRDPERTPMRWDGTKNAGFTREDARPWLPVGSDVTNIDVEAELKNPTSILNLTRRLLEVRRTHPALWSGTYRELTAPEDCFVFARERGQQCVVSALNFKDEERVIPTPKGNRHTVLVSTHLDRWGPLGTDSLVLRPNEGCLLLVE
jgi:alpha-glucosidase